MTDTTKTVFKAFSASDLTAEQAKLLASFNTAQQAAKVCREALEASIRKVAALPEDKALVFSYRFGPAMAVVPKDQVRKGANAGKAKQSLSEFLRAAREA